MKKRKLGRSTLEIAPLVFGGNVFGWTVDEPTTFTLLVPRVQLEPNQSAPVDTLGITAIHRFSLVPALQHGQQDIYSVDRLHGTASAQPF